ncbi:hypothetical protein KEM56_006176, partial [Ascosphaera pollenicola]
MTGTFSAGSSRPGDHPVRQPRGPPPFEELKEKPTQRYEGSKNFATRQRRKAVFDLIKAGMGRRMSGTDSTSSSTVVNQSTSHNNGNVS